MLDKIKNLIKNAYAGIFISLCLCFMLLFYEPLNIFASNLGDFWFDIYTFFPIVLLQSIIPFLLLSIFFIVIKKLNTKVYSFFVFCALIGMICTYIQGNFLVGSLPAVDGTWIDFDLYKTEKIISLILWVVVFSVILFVLIKCKFKMIEKVSMYASLVIIVMLASSMISFVTVTGFFDKKGALVATVENINTFSSDKNFLIFLVDATDSRVFNSELEKIGKTGAIFEDFTYYPDTVSGYPFTRNSIPFILSGVWYENEKPFNKYAVEAFDKSPFFNKLENENYNLNLYEFDLNNNSGMNNRFDNVKKTVSLDVVSLLKQEAKMILYKYLPYQLKSRVKAYTINLQYTKGNTDYTIFTGNNLQYYDELKKDLTLTTGNNFQYVHVEGAHVPFIYDVNLNKIEDGTYEDNVDACITMIEAYLNRLKENNVYDNSVIIIMADHGYRKINARANPILYIKGINEKHEYRVSDKKISHLDLVSAFDKLIDGASTDEIFNELDNTKRRYLLYEFDKPNIIKEQILEGNAWNPDDFTFTGEEYLLK